VTAQAAVAGGLAFLAAAQRPDGEVPVYATTDRSMGSGLALDPSIFPTALAAQCLASAGLSAHPVAERARAFLLAEMDRHGLWRHWTRAHSHHGQLPPDLDDTSCAAQALAAAGVTLPDNRRLMLANRTRQGLFHTWVIPRLRGLGRGQAAVTLRQLRHPLMLFLFFRKTSARPGDIDAVVNANVLHCLGRFDGDGMVADWLVQQLRDGAESRCDKWYDNPIVVRYFLSRALAPLAAEAGALIVERSRAAEPADALEAALLVSALLDWKAEVPPSLIDALVAAQRPSGAWPAAALYHGGRARLRGGGFAAPHPDTPHWGSEALTTAFAIEALARRQRAQGE
jgi:hypothetical protein